MRETSNLGLEQLVEAGQLRLGTVLHHKARRHPDRNVTATVTATGLKVRDRVFATPTAAARSITGKPVNGWTFWKLPSGEPLDTLRKAVASGR